jgi:hypothetical protein
LLSKKRSFNKAASIFYFPHQLLPCVAGKKLWANKYRMASGISDSGKILVTTFTKLCLLKYWDRWTANKSAQWTDSPGGNTQFKGWGSDVYLIFGGICRQSMCNKRLKNSKQWKWPFWTM